MLGLLVLNLALHI